MECQCRPGYQWSTEGRRCVRNCTGVGNSTQQPASDATPDQCECMPGMVWNGTGCENRLIISTSTFVNCSIPRGRNSPDNTTCECIGNYIYDPISRRCNINCLKFANSNGITPDN